MRNRSISGIFCRAWPRLCVWSADHPPCPSSVFSRRCSDLPHTRIRTSSQRCRSQACLRACGGRGFGSALAATTAPIVFDTVGRLNRSGERKPSRNLHELLGYHFRDLSDFPCPERSTRISIYHGISFPFHLNPLAAIRIRLSRWEGSIPNQTSKTARTTSV